MDILSIGVMVILGNSYNYIEGAVDTFVLNALSNVLYNRGLMADRFINAKICYSIVLGVASFFVIKALFVKFMIYHHEKNLIKLTVDEEKRKELGYTFHSYNHLGTLKSYSTLAIFLVVATFLAFPKKRL